MSKEQVTANRDATTQKLVELNNRLRESGKGHNLLIELVSAVRGGNEEVIAAATRNAERHLDRQRELADNREEAGS